MYKHIVREEETQSVMGIPQHEDYMLKNKCYITSVDLTNRVGLPEIVPCVFVLSDSNNDLGSAWGATKTLIITLTDLTGNHSLSSWIK